jgi:hypothetical protein
MMLEEGLSWGSKLLWLGLGAGLVWVARARWLRASRVHPYVEFEGAGVMRAGEEGLEWEVAFHVPGQEDVDVELSWHDATGHVGPRSQKNFPPGLHHWTFKPQGAHGRCWVELRTSNHRSQRYVYWTGGSHPVGHGNAQQSHGGADVFSAQSSDLKA